MADRAATAGVTDIDSVDERLRAVERAVADGDAEADLTDPTGELAERVEALEASTTEIEAGLRAVRGYVGQVRSADDAIEERADAALAAVDGVEDRIEELERRLDAVDGEDSEPPSDEVDSTRAAEAPAAATEPPSGSAAGQPGENDLRGGRPRGEHEQRARSQGCQPAAAATPSRRAHASPSHPPNGRRDGCPYCGTAADGDAAESGPQSRRDRTGDRAPVDDADERGIVARLRSAL